MPPAAPNSLIYKVALEGGGALLRGNLTNYLQVARRKNLQAAQDLLIGLKPLETKHKNEGHCNHLEPKKEAYL